MFNAAQKSNDQRHQGAVYMSRFAKIKRRPSSKQIERWLLIERAIRDNTDLSHVMIEEIFESFEDIKKKDVSRYSFG